MSRLGTKLQVGEFVITAELAPPKGADPEAILRKAEALERVDAVNLTDNQGARMRMAPLALARILLERGHEPVLQVTCRDRNRIALQADLLGAAALGIENLLVLSGDHPRFGDHPGARPVFDLDSVQLLRGIQQLQSGIDMGGSRLQSAPHFFVGASAAPAAQPMEPALLKIVKKISCGAQFFQTQAVFEHNQLEKFMGFLANYRVPVILGVVLIKNVKVGEFLNRHIPGIQVPPDLLKRLETASDPLAEGVRLARETISLARQFCQGAHLMTFGREDLIPALLAD